MVLEDPGLEKEVMETISATPVKKYFNDYLFKFLKFKNTPGILVKLSSREYGTKDDL
jgi:hypothetical protein